jgi:hypothetical protein
MQKILAAIGLAVAVPVALAAPALAKPPVDAKPSWVSSVLRQHEGFQAEVTYLCGGPKGQEGTITVMLQQLPEPGASTADTVPKGHDKAKCDGNGREVKIKIPVAKGAVQAGRTVQLHTTLTVANQPVLEHTSAAAAVGDDSAPTPSPSPTETQTPSPSASSTESEHPESEHPESEHPESEHPESEKPSPSSTPTS